MILDIKPVAIAVRKALKEASISTDAKVLLAIIRANLKYNDEEFALLEKSLSNELLSCFVLKTPIGKNEQLKQIKSALKLLERNFTKMDCLFIVDVFCRAKGWEVDIEHIFDGNSSITQSHRVNRNEASELLGYEPLFEISDETMESENENIQVNTVVSPELRDRWEFLIKSANRGIIESECALGDLFIEDMNQDQATYWYSKAAENGHAKAQWYMGMCYLKGVGKRKDFDKALYWLKKSANQNYLDSQYELGIYYYMELADNEEAIKWLNKASEQGHSEAKFFLNIAKR